MEIRNTPVLRLRLENTGRELTFRQTKILLGRNADCDLAFPGCKIISRAHAAIFYRNGRWYLSDQNSVNGTWLNGRRLPPGEEVLLRPGDCIDLAHDQKITCLESPSDAHTAPGPDPLEGHPGQRNGTPEAGFCPCCGSRATGIFCSTCGSRLSDSRPETRTPTAPPPAPQYVSPMPSPGMAPSPAPAPSMPAPAVGAAPAPKKPSFLSKLVRGKSRTAPEAPVPSAPVRPEPAGAAVTQDDVQFRGTAPESINPGEYFPVKIMMYREDDYQRADRESAALADRTKSASSSIFQASLGQEFRITLQSPDIQLDCESEHLRWNGKFAAADFEVYLPDDYAGRQLRLRGRVYSGDAVLTDLKLILQIRAPQPQSVVCEKVRLRSAFISYASADRAKVVARIQGIQLACPDMDLFFDVESLRRGENWEPRLYREISDRDLFYLFWSHNAAASEWVKKELLYAIDHKTMDFIEPIPLESPEVCAPPESLTGKHFNDWTLRYLNNG